MSILDSKNKNSSGIFDFLKRKKNPEKNPDAQYFNNIRNVLQSESAALPAVISEINDANFKITEENCIHGLKPIISQNGEELGALSVSCFQDKRPAEYRIWLGNENGHDGLRYYKVEASGSLASDASLALFKIQYLIGDVVCEATVHVQGSDNHPTLHPANIKSSTKDPNIDYRMKDSDLSLIIHEFKDDKLLDVATLLQEEIDELIDSRSM